MALEILRAERRRARLRVGISGPSGSGKTYSALLLGRGLTTEWEKIVLIDTENGSGELYSDLGPYNVITLQAPFSPEKYIEAIRAAEEAGMDVIVVDSTSHEWDGKGGCLEINELIAKTKFKGNTWSAWSETTPRHQKFIEAIVTSSCHVVTTARSKTDTIQTDDKKVKKIGLKDIQREGFEYELTVNFNLDRDGHYAIASKDRTGMFIDRDPFVITNKTGAELLAWTESGKEIPAEDINRKKAKILHCLRLLAVDTSTAETVRAGIFNLVALDPTKVENTDAILARLEALVKSRPAAPVAAAPKKPDPALGEVSKDEEPDIIGGTLPPAPTPKPTTVAPTPPPVPGTNVAQVSPVKGAPATNTPPAPPTSAAAGTEGDLSW